MDVSKFLNLLQNKKILASIIGVICILFIGVLGFVFKDNILEKIKSSQLITFNVSGSNFDLSRGVLPYNASSIDFYFSDEIDEKSLTSDNFTITPDLEGYLSLKNPKTISYNITGEIEVGDEFTINIGSNLRSKNNSYLGSDLIYNLQIVSGAEVLSVTPTGELQNLSQAVNVFFNMPMVPLTNLDEKDSLPCPLEITPKVSGECSWLTTSVLEFRPDSHFSGATTFDLKVKDVDGLNYSLEDDFEFQIKTPDLDLSVLNNFNPLDKIIINSNFPVSIDDLSDKLSLFRESRSNNIKFTLKDLGNNTRFKIIPTNEEYLYNTSYIVEIRPGLKPIYGNNSMKNDYLRTIKSTDFLNYIRAHADIKTSTGKIIDTRVFPNILPNDNVFFNINFRDEVPLDKSLFSFGNDDDNIPFDIEYNKSINSDGDEKIDKKSIRLSLNKNLKNSNTYTLSINSKANSNLSEDIIRVFNTSDILTLNSFEFIDYSNVCIYVNNELSNTLSNDNFSTTPSSIFRGFRQVYRWYFESEWARGDIPCERNPDEGESVYMLNVRLNPNSTYELKAHDITDIYGNNVDILFTKEVKTGELKDRDKFVYSTLPNHVNLFPKGVEKLLNIQTVNTDKIYIDVCEMSDLSYMEYLKNLYSRDFEIICDNKTSKQFNSKSRYWTLTSNYFDLEEEILGREMKYNHILVNAYVTPSKSRDNSYFSKVITTSDISLYLEKASNKSIVFPTTLDGNNFVPNLTLEFYDANLSKVTQKYEYNSNTGGYDIDSDLSGIRFVRAFNDKYSGFIDLSFDQLHNFEFGYISGNDSSAKDFLYLYSDKPIYKPGERVNLKGLLRYFDFDGYKSSSIKSGTLIIRDNNWQELTRIDVEVDDNSNFDTSFLIPEDVNLGYFAISFEGNDGKGNTIRLNNVESLHIEEYKAPTFRVSVNDDANSDSLLLGDEISFDINPEYYFGGNIINTSGRYTVLAQNYFFDAKDYSNFQFGEGYGYFNCLYWGSCNFSDRNVRSGNFDIDSSGNGNVSYKFDKEGEKIYNFSFTIKDPDTSREVTKTVSKVVHNTDGYVGLQTRYFNEFDKGIKFDAITLNIDASVKPNTKIDFTLVKKDWKKVREKGVDGVFYYNYSLVEEEVDSVTLTSNTRGEITYTFKPKISGQYDIIATYTGSNKESFISKSEVYLAGEEFVSWRNDNNSITDLTPEKTIYNIGETADFTLQSPVNKGKAIFFIEKDDGILDYFVHNIESYGDKISIDIKEEYYPNIYLKGYLIGTKPGDKLPTYKRALGVIKVLSDHKELNLEVKTDKPNYKPRDKVEISIKVVDKNGNPVSNANGSVSVVDESVLALKGNPKRNPFSFFYDMKRYLGVLSYLNLKHLVEKLEVRDISSGEKGGSGDNQKGGDSEKPRGDFRDVALWEANFQTDENGIANIVIDKLPDNLTTWVIETIVNTTDKNKVGVDYSNFSTSLDVMIQDNLPRVFGAGDSIVVSPVVHNRTGKSQNFEISVEATNAYIYTNKRTFRVENNSQERVEFVLNINQSTNITDLLSKIKITAKAIDSNTIDSVVKYIPITESKTPEFVTTRGSTKNVSHNETIRLGDSVLKIGANLQLNYGGSLFSNFLDYINVSNLSFNTSSSSSHKTSILNPFVQVKKLYNSLEKEYDFNEIIIKRYVNTFVGFEEISLDSLITSYLLEISSYQNTDGGFMYFTDSLYRDSDYTLSKYILTSLSDIRYIGYNVPERIFTSGARYLKSQIRNTPICDGTNWSNCMTKTQKISGLITLLDINKNDYDVYTITQNLDFNPASHPISARLEYARLLSKIIHIDTLGEATRNILIQESKDIVQNVISNGLVFNPRGAFIGRDSNFNRNYNTSLFLDVISGVGLEHFSNFDDIRDNIIRFLVGEIDSNTTLNITNTNAFRFIVNYMSRDKDLVDTDMYAKINFNNKSLDERRINRDNIFDSYSKNISLDNIGDTSIFNIEKSGTGKVYYDLSLSYFLPIEDIHARDNGFSIKREYYSYNDYKKIHDLKEAEYKKYLSGELTFDELEYKKDVVDYIDQIKNPRVGDLILVYNRLITSAPRDNVEINAFIPSGTELVNTRLDTEEQNLVGIGSNFRLDREELRHDRYDGFVSRLNTGVYNFSYIIRATHKGEFEVRPTMVRELNTPEVFGRTSGELFEIR